MSYTPQELTAVLQKYKAGKQSLERRVIAAENWWKLRNRFEEDKRPGASSAGDFRAVSGWLHNVIVSKHADAMEAYPEPVILPREPDDRAEAELLSAVVPCILEQNAFERTWSDAMWQKLKTGTAAYRVGWDPDKLGGLGDISIERVDLLNLFWEPGIADIQRSKFVFCTHLEDNDELEEEFPQLRGRLRGNPFTATRFLYDDAVSLDGKSTVVEAYYRRKRAGRTVLHYVKYVGDTVLYSTEEDTPQASPFRGKCPVRTLGDGGAKLGQVPSSDPAALSVSLSLDSSPEGGAKNEAPDGLYAHGRYPFVLDPLFPVEGSPCGYGFVDLCHNNQTAIDLMRSAIIKNTVVGATPRYFQRIDGSVNEEEFADLGRALVHVSGNLGEDSLRQIGFSPLSGVYMDVLNSSIQELRETSGNTETSTGNISSGVTAASAIAALQEASGKGSRDSTRSSYVAYAQIVELCIELIRQFYGLPRSFRIAGRAGAEEYIRFSNAGLCPRPQLAAARAVDSNPTGSGQATPSNYPRLRALIEKTAGEIYSHVDAINRQLRADYVARSELGEFEERVTAGMEATARGVVEDYDYDARLTASDERAGRIEEHLRSLSGQIRRGLITDPETGEQVLGIAISQRLSFTGASSSHEGETYYELSPGQTLGMYTSTGWQFWINGARRGWFDSVDGTLHVAALQVEQSLRLGDSWVVSTAGGFGIRVDA